MRIVVLSFVLLAIVHSTTGQQKVITAGNAITEIVCELGDCDKIIATDRTSFYPAKMQQLPSIGYRSGINAEGVLSLKPTLDERVIRKISVQSPGYLVPAVFFQPKTFEYAPTVIP